MTMIRPILLIALCLAAAWPMSFEKRELVSPITGRRFPVVVIPVDKANRLEMDHGPADMGIDADGCRHSAGVSEYDHYIITDPTSYFSALAVEWDERGRFRFPLPEGFSEWIRSKDGFNSERVIDYEQKYKKWQQINSARGRAMPRRQDWLIPQDEIPVGKKYKFAIGCYTQRGYPAGFIGKVALTGSWAIRARIQRPIAHTRLAGGPAEVNSKIAEYIQDGEVFDLDKWLRVYRELLDGRLTDEGYCVAAVAYLGFLVREGQVGAVSELLNQMMERFRGERDLEIMRQIVRERRNTLKLYYYPFLEQAAFHLRRGLANEEFPRPKIPEIVLAVAESLRRIDRRDDARNWYLALANMAETQPQVRSEIREAGGAPGVDAPYHVHLGWRADAMVAELSGDNPENAIRADGEEAKLLDAIVNRGLGLPEYRDPAWQPLTGRTPQQCERVLDAVGKAVLDYRFRMRVWPDSLGDMWLDGFVRNRNQLNRFHCPGSGRPYAYVRPEGEEPGPATVIVATQGPIETAEGLRHAAFTAGGRVVWGEGVFIPGEQAAP